MKMATRKLTAGNIVAAVFDSNFSFSDGDSSRKRIEKLTMLTGAMQQ